MGEPRLDFFGQDAKFHHVGIAVRSITEACSEGTIFTDNVQNVRVAFLSLNGLNSELIEPLDENSPVTQCLRKGNKFVHICYEVPDIEKTLRECRKHGFHRIGKVAPAVAFNNRRIAWVYSSQYGLFELLEKDSGDESL